MPQQEDSIVSTFSSGTSDSVRCTACIAPKAFWWQCPCSSARFSASGLSLSARRPASCSSARNSSKSSACAASASRSEEHTSELQSPDHLVCRLLLEKKKRKSTH